MYFSGYLEPEELRNLLIECGVDNPDDDDVEYLLEAADTNHDGKIALQGKFETFLLTSGKTTTQRAPTGSFFVNFKAMRMEIVVILTKKRKNYAGPSEQNEHDQKIPLLQITDYPTMLRGRDKEY